MDAGAPNSPEREAWMKEQRLRDDIAAGEAHIAGYQDWLNAKRRQLAEALCPFKVGDRLVSDSATGIKYLVSEIGLSGDNDWHAYLTLTFEDGMSDKRLFTSDYLTQHFMVAHLAPEPAPDPEVEAVAKIIAHLFCGGVVVEGHREAGRRIIAALDAVRAERRAKAQDARVEAALEILRGCFNDSSVSWDGLAKRILAAADAAEARNG